MIDSGSKTVFLAPTEVLPSVDGTAVVWLSRFMGRQLVRRIKTRMPKLQISTAVVSSGFDFASIGVSAISGATIGYNFAFSF